MKVPQTTTPLTKFIRTTEGWIVVGSNVVLILVPILTNALSAKEAAVVGGVLNGVTVISRSVLKAVASLKPITGDPIYPDNIDPSELEVEMSGGTDTPIAAGSPSTDVTPAPVKPASA